MPEQPETRSIAARTSEVCSVQTQTMDQHLATHARTITVLYIQQRG